MTEQNEQEVTDVPVIPDELKNDAAKLYQLIGAVVHQLGHHRIEVPAADAKQKYQLRVEEGETRTLIVSNKVVEEWAGDSPAS